MKSAAKYVRGTLVDVGCGAKPYKKYLTGSVQNYIGLDYPASPESMDAVVSSPPEVYANALQIPLKDNCIDSVILTQVLEHVPAPECTIKEIKRILKKDGTLIISAPMLYPIHSAPYDYFRFTRHGIEELLAKNGFSITELKENGGLTASVALFVNLFLMHKLFNLSSKKATVLLALPLAPIVILLATLLNLAAYILQPIDKERRFTLNYFVVSRKG
jgi:SAM-dependent methyltransferase